jgi:hypothetical protein
MTAESLSLIESPSTLAVKVGKGDEVDIVLDDQAVEATADSLSVWLAVSLAVADADHQDDHQAVALILVELASSVDVGVNDGMVLMMGSD